MDIQSTIFHQIDSFDSRKKLWAALFLMILITSMTIFCFTASENHPCKNLNHTQRW
jgi:hypothetical protein